ncbi:Pr6Pr family membrane protein [Tenacibaculum mesophilum]|uniref:Pr6Pr family membrane protein n=1 Tax=Tenacibaculum mesophilum TaxID=104268 RepID=UPI00064A6ADD|nr:Pr6Pr family membrane protein [Tenacibaculum mesophilum]
MKRKAEIIGFCITWFAIITQFVLMIINRQTDVQEAIIRFFSFFTILTNTLVALFFTNKITRKMNTFNKNGALTAITSFILIVGLVYQVVLRATWNPTGLQLVVDELLHTIIPTYMFIYWLLYAKSNNLKLKYILPWLTYPIFYIVYIMIRGNLSGFYPYPFLNVTKIGLQQSIINISVILIVSLILMSLLILIGKKLKSIKL